MGLATRPTTVTAVAGAGLTRLTGAAGPVTASVGTVATAGGRSFSAELVPLSIAAEGLLGAHAVRDGVVVTPKAPVRFTAGTGGYIGLAGITAVFGDLDA